MMVSFSFGDDSDRSDFFRGNEGLFRAMFEVSGTGFIFADPATGRYLWFNRKFCEITGYSADELRELTFPQLTHPDDRESDWQDYLRLVNGDIPEYTVEKRYIRKSGEVIWVRVNCVITRDDEGTAVYDMTVIEDITERKRAEERIRESEERFRNMADGASVIIWVTDPLGDCTYLNQRWYEFTGTAREESLGLGWLNSVHPDDRGLAGDMFLRATRLHEAFRVEYRLRRNDGEYRWVIDSASPRLGSSGEYLGHVGSVIDITERKIVEDRLRDSEQQLRIALETARLGSWQLDLSTGVLDCSANCKANFGLPPNTTLTYDLLVSLIHPEDRRGMEASVQEAIAEQSVYDVEYRAIWPDGSIHWIVASGRGIYDGNGTPVRMVGVTLDITERKQAEAEREDLLARTQEARQEAESANRAKDEFLAIVSHELRTPLNAVIGWAHMLQSGDLDEESFAYAIDVIARNATAQAQLIEDLLDVSRIISGKLTLEHRPVEPSRVIKEATDSLRHAAEGKSLGLQVVLDPAADFVLGDADRLRQVVWNLLSNAIKFTPAGGKIRIHLDQVGSHARIAVSDTGQGIREDLLPYIFDRFRQADGSTTRRHSGLGLGLAIVRHLVELHAGTVEVYSKGEGKGSTFTIHLPLAPRLQERGAPPAGRASRPGGRGKSESARRKLEGVSVLVVDDQEDAREMLRAVLSHQGADVRVSASALEALDTLSAWRPGILVSDIGMPEEDGYSLIGRIRRLHPEHGGEIPAIALTGYTRVEDRLRVLQAGFQMFVPKPVEPDELVSAILSLMTRS